MTRTPKPQANKTIDEIIKKLHPHGQDCFCEDDELGLTSAKANKAIEALITEAEKKAYEQGVNKGIEWSTAQLKK